jgi:hypothetical protein
MRPLILKQPFDVLHNLLKSFSANQAPTQSINDRTTVMARTFNSQRRLYSPPAGFCSFESIDTGGLAAKPEVAGLILGVFKLEGG